MSQSKENIEEATAIAAFRVKLGMEKINMVKPSVKPEKQIIGGRFTREFDISGLPLPVKKYLITAGIIQGDIFEYGDAFACIKDHSTAATLGRPSTGKSLCLYIQAPSEKSYKLAIDLIETLVNTVLDPQKKPIKRPLPSRSWDRLLTNEFEIKDLMKRTINHLITKGIIQGEIYRSSGAVVSARGSPYLAEGPRKESSQARPLYLLIQGPNEKTLYWAVEKIKQLIKQAEEIINNDIPQARSVDNTQGSKTTMPSLPEEQESAELQCEPVVDRRTTFPAFMPQLGQSTDASIRRCVVLVHWLLAHPLLVAFMAQRPKEQTNKVSEKCAMSALFSLREYEQHKCSHFISEKLCQECMRFYRESQKNVRECCEYVLTSGYDISVLVPVDEYIKDISVDPDQVGVVYDYPFPKNLFFMDSCRLFIDLVINYDFNFEEPDIECYFESTDHWYPLKAYQNLILFSSSLDINKVANNPKTHNYPQYSSRDHHGGLINFRLRTLGNATPGQRAHPDTDKISKWKYFPFLNKLSTFTKFPNVNKNNRPSSRNNLVTNWAKEESVKSKNETLGSESSKRSILPPAYNLTQECGKNGNLPKPPLFVSQPTNRQGNKRERVELLHQSPLSTQGVCPPFSSPMPPQANLNKSFGTTQKSAENLENPSRNRWDNLITQASSLLGSTHQNVENPSASTQSPLANFEEPPKKMQKLQDNLPLSFKVMQEPRDSKSQQGQGHANPKRRQRKEIRKFLLPEEVANAQATLENIQIESIQPGNMQSGNMQSLMGPLQTTGDSAMHMLMGVQPSQSPNLQQIISNMQQSMPVYAPAMSGIPVVSSEPNRQPVLNQGLFNTPKPLESAQNYLQQTVDNSLHNPFSEVINKLQEYIVTTDKKLADCVRSVDSTYNDPMSTSKEAVGSNNSQQLSGSMQQTQPTLQQPTPSTQPTESPFSSIIQQLQQYIEANNQTASQEPSERKKPAEEQKEKMPEVKTKKKIEDRKQTTRDHTQTSGSSHRKHEKVPQRVDSLQQPSSSRQVSPSPVGTILPKSSFGHMVSILGDSLLEGARAVWGGSADRDCRKNHYKVADLKNNMSSYHEDGKLCSNCIVMIGVNDAILMTAHGTLVSEFKILINSLLKHEYKVFLVTLPLQVSSSRSVNKDLIYINDFIMSFKSKSNVTVIQFHKHFFKPEIAKTFLKSKHTSGKGDLVILNDTGCLTIMNLVEKAMLK